MREHLRMVGPKRASLNPKNFSSDPDEYYVPGPGDKGVSISCRVSTETAEFVQEVVQSGKFRYRTAADLIRASLEYFIRNIVAPRMDKRFQRDVQLMSFHNRAARRIARANDIISFIATNRTTFTILLRQNLLDEAADHYNEVMEAASLEGPTWSPVKEWLLNDPRLKPIRQRVANRLIER